MPKSINCIGISTDNLNCRMVFCNINTDVINKNLITDRWQRA